LTIERILRMKYKATVHTLEINPLLPETVSSGKWIRAVFDQDRDYVSSIRPRGKKSEPRLVINPHKADEPTNGLYHFEYDGLTRHKEIMQRICKELNMNEYIIRRFDVCLDTDQPYEQTEKITRLIMLLLGENIGADNRYASYDPLTLESKTTRIQNGDKKTRTLEMEHYNRAVIDQTKWDTTIINRFELRAMGARAGKNHDERSIVQGWIDRLQSIDPADIRGLESTLNSGIYAGWEAYAKESGKQTSKADFNAYLRFNADHIYSRAQLKDLFTLYGKDDPEKAVQHIVSKERSGNRFEKLYTEREIRAAIKSMIDALTEFIDS